jgi:predicted nucleotidyltransferase
LRSTRRSNTLNAMKARTDEIAALCEHHGIESLHAFGSRARETADWVDGKRPALAHSSTDVDIGALPKHGRKLSIREKSTIAIELEEILQAGRVDLVILPEVDPFLAANVIRGERLYCRDTYAADEYELYVLRRAGDLAPLERQRLSLIEGK